MLVPTPPPRSAYLALLKFQRGQLRKLLALDEARQDVQLHRDHHLARQAVEKIRLDILAALALPTLADGLARAILHGDAHRRIHLDVLAKDLARQRFPIIRRLHRLEVGHLQTEEQILDGHLFYTKLLEELEVDGIAENLLNCGGAPHRQAGGIRGHHRHVQRASKDACAG